MGKEIYNDGKYRAVVVCGWNDTEEETKETIGLAQIKKTGFRQTVEEFEQLKNDAYEHRMNISDYLRFLVLKERHGIQKNISKKPIQKTENEFICPSCKTSIGYRFLEMDGKKHKIMENFCDCGQELDWSDERYNVDQSKINKILFPNKCSDTEIYDCMCNK